MTHSLTADLGSCDFNAAALADLSAVSDALVFSAVALPVLCRSENTLAEKSLALGLKCAVVNGFGLGYLAVRPFSDLLGGSKTDFN